MKLKVTVHGVAYEVEVEVLDPGEGFPQPVSALPSVPQTARPPSGGPMAPPPAPVPSMPRPQSGGGDGGSVTSPIAGTVVSVDVKPGAEVTEGQTLLVIEAMKMNTNIAAPTAGRIKAVQVAAGDAIREGQTLVEYE